MSAGQILDLVIVVLMIAALVGGIARGLLHTLGSVLGVVIGGAASLVVMPIVSREVPAAGWNVVAALGSGLVLVIVGLALGSAIGRRVRRPVHRSRLAGVDRLLGGAGGLAATCGLVLTFAMSVGSMGVPFLAQAVASSKVLGFIQQVTPGPVEGSLARLRSLAVEDGIPTVLDAAGIDDAEVPTTNAETASLQRASESVMRITTNAPSCSMASSGSGFVISDDLVMTNAHVVAGAQEVVVEPPGQLPREARVVYFDPSVDIAVVSATGIDAPALPFSADPATGDTVFFQGYPYGGPFVSRSASALATGPLLAADIYDGSSATRSVTTIAGVVQPGNSGGPLLTAEGAVAGMIFARSEVTPDVGFALSMEELAPVLAQADTMQDAVSTGACA